MTTPSYPAVPRGDLSGFFEVMRRDYERRRTTQRVPYSATITPDPTRGENIIVGLLTGNITVDTPINAHEGMWLRFTFTEDGTGGYTITFASAFLTNWTPSTTADESNTISFRYDGTNWVQMASAVGLT